MSDASIESRRTPPPRIAAPGELVSPSTPPVRFEHLALLTVLDDQPAWSHGATVCRRVVLVSEDCGVVVFVSDANSEGRSITNVLESLCKESRRDVLLSTPSGAEVIPTKIRWYECRTGEATKSGVPQSLCFDEFVETPGGSPTWVPARDSFSVNVALVLNIQAVSDLVEGLRAE